MAKQVGPYTIHEKLGQGGMGTVFRARRDDLQKDFALKVIARKSGSLENEKRFKREAQAAAKLSDHPGIVGVHDVGETEKYVYFAMDLVPGGAMNEKLKEGALSFDDAAQLIEEAAEAVQYAHDHGILHRDIKPANIMIGADGAARVADFGLAKSSDTDSETAKLTRSGQVLGTPAYMSPEQASGTQVDARSDIYSLGASLYEALAGEPPFLGDTVYAILAQLLKDEPKPPVKVDPDCPKALSNIAMKCLEKKPALRYQTAGELADDLVRYRQGEAVGARSKSAWQTASTKAVRSPAVLGGIVVALVAVIGLLLVLMPGAGASDAETEAAKTKARLEAKRAKEAKAAEAAAAAKAAKAKARMGEMSAWAEVLETLTDEGRASEAAELALERFRTRYPESDKAAEAAKMLEAIPALRANKAEMEADAKLSKLIVAAAESGSPQDRDAVRRFAEAHAGTAAAERATAWLERNPAVTAGDSPEPGTPGSGPGPVLPGSVAEVQAAFDQALEIGNLQLMVDVAKAWVKLEPESADAKALLDASRFLKRAWIALDRENGSRADGFLEKAAKSERIARAVMAVRARRQALYMRFLGGVVTAPKLEQFLAAADAFGKAFPEDEQVKLIVKDAADLRGVRTAIDGKQFDEARRILNSMKLHDNVLRHAQELVAAVPELELRPSNRPPPPDRAGAERDPANRPEYAEPRAITDASRKATLAGLPRAIQRLVEKADDPVAVLDGREPVLQLPGLLQRGELRWNGVFSPDGKLLRLLGGSGGLRIYSLERAKMQTHIKWENFVAAIDTKVTGATDLHAQFSPDSRMLLVWSKQYRGAVVWASSGRGRPLFIDTGKGPQHQSKPNRAFWFGKKKVLVMGGRRTDVWAPGRRKPERIATDHHAIWDLCPFGTEILTRNNDQGAHRRAAKPDAELVPVAQPSDRFRAGAYSPDGRWVAMVDERDWRIRIFERKSMSLKRRFPGLRADHGVRRLVFAPDGSALFVGGGECIRRHAVDATLDDATRKLYWLAGGASSVAFDEDGAVMLGASRDGFTVWDLRTDEVILRGTTPGGGVYATIGPKGRFVATHNGEQNTTYLWVVPRPAR